MSVDVFAPTIDGATVDGHNSAAVGYPGFISSSNPALPFVPGSPSPGTFSIDKKVLVGGVLKSDFSGSYVDHYGTDPSLNVASTSLFGFDNAHQIITFVYNYVDGTSSAPFGGQIIGYTPFSLLVDQINGFFDLGGGNFVGTISPNQFQIFSQESLSLKQPGFAVPTLPLVFGQTGPFVNVPEPSSALLIAAAAVVFLIARLPVFRRSSSSARAA